MHLGQKFWRKQGLGAKLAITNFVCVTVIVLTLIACIGWGVMRTMQSNVQSELEAGVATIGRFIASSDKDVRQRTEYLAKSFAHSVQGLEFGGQGAATSLSLNGEVLADGNVLVDRFTQTTNAVATVFAKQGSNFVRVASSVKDAGGQRVTGTQLDTQHPAFAALSNGTPYMGLATLFGRQYMTHYSPLKNAAGVVVGATFVGEDFSAAMAGLKQAIRELKVGKDGYYFVLRSDAGKDAGTLVVHPSQEGSNIIGSKDSNGREFIREIVERKNGTISYPWLNPGETSPREKIAAFGHYAPWDWVYASSAYVDEYVAHTRQLLGVLALLGMVAVLSLSGLWWWLVGRMIVRPLLRAERVAKAIAQGDLTQKASHRNADEIGHLITAMNDTVDGLTGVVRTVQTRAQEVATASAQIAQGNLDLASRTESSASALEQTAAAMEELGSTVAHNAEHAQSATELTRAAQQVVTEGGHAVREVTQTMQGIDASSQKIANIIGVIDGIAFQTNILALNAAVEAARAGEQGRGFAVVAGEVRSLAQRSAEAAKEIKQLIQTSVQEIHAGNQRATRAAQTMEQAMQEIQKVTNLIADISHASKEQSNGVGQVAEAITDMDQSTQKNAALVEEMAGAAESLRNQSVDLLQAVSVFRTEMQPGQGPLPEAATPGASVSTPAPALAPARAKVAATSASLAPAAQAGAAPAAALKVPAKPQGAAPRAAKSEAAVASASAAAPAKVQKPQQLAHAYQSESDDWESF